MKKKFYRHGDTYTAVNYQTKTVWICSLLDDGTSAQVGTGDRFIMNLGGTHLYEEISEAEFAVHFSSAVAKLHSQTPYA